MTTGPAPICMWCTHLRQDKTDWPPACDAYPHGIPEPIMDSDVDHRQPYDGDGGIQFEPVDAAAADYAELLFREPATADEGD